MTWVSTKFRRHLELEESEAALTGLALSSRHGVAVSSLCLSPGGVWGGSAWRARPRGSLERIPFLEADPPSGLVVRRPCRVLRSDRSRHHSGNAGRNGGVAPLAW